MIVINVRQSTGTYLAKAKGYKPSASCSTGPAQAAEALVRKLGLAPDLLEEVTGTNLPYGRRQYQHPGTEATNTSGNAHCPGCGICHTKDETCNQAIARTVEISGDTK